MESERAALEESLSCRSDWHPDEIQKVVEECAKWERYAKQMDSERAELAREVERLHRALEVYEHGD